MKNGSSPQDSRCADQYAEVPSVDACETITATDTTDDAETALGHCLDEDNIVIVQMISLHICTLYGGEI